MRRIVPIAIMASVLCACSGTSDDGFVDARDACFAIAKAADDVTLTTSGMKANIVRKDRVGVTYSWSASEHGADYTCVVNVTDRRIVAIMKNQEDLTFSTPENLRTF